MHSDRSESRPFLVQPLARKKSQFSEPSSRSSSPDSSSSTSHARWERIRQHVLPSSSSQPHSGHSQQTSSISSTTYPSRPQTPKPSRLARFGLRQVVDQAREAQDLSQKFADDIQKACWHSRYTDHGKGFRVDRDGLSASMPYLPAIPNSSPYTTTNSSVIGLPAAAHWRSDNRSLYNTTPYLANARPVHSLLNLLRNTSPTGVGAVLLPHETLVLSALLTPFLTGEHVEGADDRVGAVEAFETAVTKWRAETTELSVERCHWCCKAAALCPIPLRMRILRLLELILFPRESSLDVKTLATFQSLLQGLFQLLQSIASQYQSGPEPEDVRMVKRFISQVQAGSCGEIERTSVEEEYGASYSRGDNDQNVRQIISAQCLVWCLENGSESNRRWIIHNILEEYWPAPRQPLSFTPLFTALHTRKLDCFSRAAVSLLRSKFAEASTRRYDAETIVRIFRSRVVPESESLSGPGIIEARARIIRIILELFNADHPGDSPRWGMALFSHWYQVREWKPSFESTLKDLVQNNSWYLVLRILAPFTQALPEDSRKSVVVFVLPLLHERLVADPPPHPSPLLSDFLDLVSRWHPDVFYKPLVSCTASSKELTVATQLCVIAAVSRFLPDIWMRDLDMTATVLMMDIASQGKGKSTNVMNPIWGKARLGQSALILEVISWIRSQREKAKGPNAVVVSIEAMGYITALESRLSKLLEAKETKTLVPLPQRLLFCMLFLQIRSMTRSLNPSPWFSRVISWFFVYWTDAKAGFDKEIEEAAEQLRSLYSMAQQGFRPQNMTNSLILSPTADSGFLASMSGSAIAPITFDRQLELVTSFSHGFSSNVLELLVNLSGLLTTDDYRRLGPSLWNDLVDVTDSRIIAPACFLIMQCAERDRNILNLIEYDLRSPDTILNIRAISKINLLFNWRFQILSQPFITDRLHRRPFKLARDPLPFVSTDVGTHLFIPLEDVRDSKDSLPVELRRQLTDIGWTENDEPVNKHLEWLQTPFSLLPVHQLERIGNTSEQPLGLPPSPNLSPVPSPTKSPGSDDGQDHSIQRQTSTSGNTSYGVKRRVVFVPALASLLPHLALLVFHSNFQVASAARAAMIDIMRNEPALLTRPVFDLLSDEQRGMAIAIRSLRAFLHVRSLLPPVLSHHVFNGLAGFLKYAARRTDKPETFKQFALTIPTLSKIGTQVSEMSTREIRRAKIEVFLIPTGALWFSPSAPAGPMFPRGFGTVNNPFDTAPANLVFMSVIRLSQHMFFLAMLKRTPQDIQIVRKQMSSIVLPSRENQYGAGALKLSDYVPLKLGSRQAERLPLDVGLSSLSLMLSRSYLLVIAQIFRSMSRHLSDRNELAVHIDGLKRILLAHGDDIGIVTHAMIALMVASTRFRRLFASKAGFTLFMPVLFKTYAEAEHHSGIRNAIVYAVHRFFAQHGENFVFQSIDTLAQIVMLPDVDGDWIARNVFSLFTTLKTILPPTTPDAAGIRNANKEQEREDLIVRTAEEKPQTYLDSLRQTGNNGNVMTAPPLEYEAKPLRSDDFVRLFLTVIAHDPTISRAENFLRLFQHLTPYFYNASGVARDILRDGIDALGLILQKTVGRTRQTRPALDTTDADPVSRLPEPMASEVEGTKSASDVPSMRMDFLSMVVKFTQTGGQLQLLSSQRVMEVVRLSLKDSTEGRREAISSFFTEYAKASLLRSEHSSPKDPIPFLSELATLIPLYVFDVDFSGIFDAVSSLVSNPFFANEPQFCNLVVPQLCGSTLQACHSSSISWPFFSTPLRLSLVSLIAQAIYLPGVDVMSEVEKVPVSVDFLSGVILPLVLTLKSSMDRTSDYLQMEFRQRSILTKTWVRVLHYVMSASRKGITLDERSKSTDRQKTQAHLRTMVVQTIKIIVIRAENDLSSHFPGIWSRVGSFLNELLEDGSASFALRFPEPYTPSTPTHSPRNSDVAFGSLDPSSSLSEFGVRYRSHPSGSPRFVDYSMWSLFEFLCQCRHPLLLQLRVTIMIKVATLDHILRHSQHSARLDPGFRSRRTSTAFSKPRLAASTSISLSLSPESSYRPSASPSYQYGSGFRQFPTPPPVSPLDTYGQRSMLHSGIAESPMLSSTRRSGDSGESGRRSVGRHLCVKSPSLALATYRRIRVVQSYLGYDALLPLPDGESEECLIASWTGKQALNAIVQETKELMEEFRELVQPESHNGILVESLAI